MKKETQQQELMIKFKEFNVYKGNINTDKLVINFEGNKTCITLIGTYYRKIFWEIINLNKEEIIEYFNIPFNYEEHIINIA